VKYALAVLACLFLLAHLFFLPPELEDIDSVNFALGVRDFDVARHQPHPPGYPVFIALAKVSTALFGGAGSAGAIVRGLAVWSAVAGAALVALLFALFRALGATERQAWWGMAIAVTSPLFWFTALRPLSDMTGLAMAVGAQALLVAVLPNRARERAEPTLVGGAFLAALAAGVRVQTVLLTGPLLLAALILPRAGVSLRARLLAALAGAAGVLAWGVPLILANGGVQGYFGALGAQAGEDFSGVVMLWTNPRPRVALNAFAFSFLWPWGDVIIGAIVLTGAAFGFARLLWRQPAAAVWLFVAFVPYAIFHLLFHETPTVRYALPLIVPIALLASMATDLVRRPMSIVLNVALVGTFLILSIPAVRGYGSTETPAFQALSAVRAGSPEMPTPVGMHAVFRRISEWRPPAADVLRAAHGHEWLALVERWRAAPDASMSFIADPRRTDLALLDPHTRDLERSFRWSFPALPYVGGLRPRDADLYLLRPPTWMLDKGWALSAEIAGVSTRDAAGPHLRPSIAWVRAKAEPMLLMYGGRNPSADASTELLLASGETTLDRVSVGPGMFFRLLPLPPASTGDPGYVPVTIRTSGGPQLPVYLDQFDVQPEGVEMFGYAEGWHAPEYDPQTAVAWRWVSERSALWVRPLGSDIVLTISGESPMRYFDSPPAVVLSVAGHEIRRFVPTADFTEMIQLPAALLEAGGGRVTIESNRWFVPTERGDSVDKRHLALRIYSVSVARRTDR
jgi:hypothetical protein